MSSPTGVTLSSMDETPEPDVAPEVEPLNWSKLDPKLTKALVVAMRLATTVDNDGHNQAQNYRYPTQAAIACKAREAMGEAGIHCPLIGWRPSQGTVCADFVIVHESGVCSPVFSAQMPVGNGRDPAKQLAASLSILRKYVLAGLLNMGWRDPTEDIDAEQPQGQKRTTPQNQQRPAQKTQPVDPIAQHRDAAVRDARSWAKWLISRGLAASNLHHFATGCDGDMPKPPLTSVLNAISLAGNTMHAKSAGDDLLIATRHVDLVEFMVDHEIVPLWSYGKRSADGDSVDEKWPIGR